MCRSSDPTIKSTWIRESFTPFSRISSLLISRNPSSTSGKPAPAATWQHAFSSKRVLKNISPDWLIGDSFGTSATSPSIAAPSSMANIFFKTSSPCSAWQSTTFPSLKSTVKLLMICPDQLKGFVETRRPSHFPLIGLVKTSSVGMFGT